MSHIGRTAKDSVVAEAELANVDEADVLGLRAEVQRFVAKVKRDIATGFQGDTKVHNAWLDEVLTESEQIRTRLNDLPAAYEGKTADCATLLGESDTLLREQIEICHQLGEASAADHKGKQSDLGLQGKPSELRVDSHSRDKQSLPKRAGNVGDSDDEASDLPSPRLASSTAGGSDRDPSKVKGERGHTAHSQAAIKSSQADDESRRSGSNRGSSSANRDQALPGSVHHRAKVGTCLRRP
jgi:hypothetical protein